MAGNKPYYLCGGVLFFLLTEAALPDGSAEDHENGISDEHSDPILMRDLIYAFCGDHGYGTQKDTSQYKDCQIEGGKNIPFNNIRLCAGYDQEIRNQYDNALRRMDGFVGRHLDRKAKDWLVKALLEIIEKDQEMPGDERLYVSPDGIHMTKTEICGESDFDISAFLVGLLHFITDKRREKNRLGVPTLDAIGEKSFRRPRRYTGNLGEALTRDIKVAFLPTRQKKPVEEPNTILAPDDVEEESDDEVINGAVRKTGQMLADVLSAIPQPKLNVEGLAKAMAPIAAAADAYKLTDKQVDNLTQGLSTFAAGVEAQKHALAEKIRESGRREESTSSFETREDDASEEQTDKKSTIIQQQTNVIQNGDNNVNVTNNGTINLNF